MSVSAGGSTSRRVSDEQREEIENKKIMARDRFYMHHPELRELAPINRPSVTSKPVVLTTPPLPAKKSLPHITVHCSLVSRQRFIVEAKFDPKLVELFKKFPRSRYDAATKHWTFDLADHDMLVNQAKSLDCVASVDPLPYYVLNAFRGVQPKILIPEVNLESVDFILRDKLFPFQVTGVCFGISKQGRCLIADDMGLGKTMQALAIAAYYKSDWPLLVIAPSSVRYAWREAFFKWLPSVDPATINVLNTGKDAIGSARVYITSYELMVRMGDVMAKKNFQIIIADESHMMKSWKAARTQTILPLLKQAKRAILLSGTPALSRPVELFTQVSAVNPGAFPTFTQFGVRYCGGKMTHFGWEFSGSTHTTELVLLLEELAMIRRLKADVIEELPPKRREMILLDPTSIKHNSKQMQSANSLLQNTNIVGMERRGYLLQYYAMTAECKLPAVMYSINILIQY